MLASDPATLTYAVVTDELLTAAATVGAITESARTAEVESLPASVSIVGHEVLEMALRDFCARWDTGLSHLVGDSETMAQRLRECATAYVANEETSEGGFQALLSYAPRPPWGDLPPVGPIG